MLLLLFLLIKIGLFNLITTQNPSPCPNIFTYETRNLNENDRWYGILSLQTNEDLNGVWIHITLDQPALQLGNWFGNTTNVDNREYVIKNPKYRLEAGPPITVRFFIRYEPNGRIPSVQSIRLNGKTICSIPEDDRIPITEPTLHLSEIRPNNNNNNRGQNQNRIPPGHNKRPSQSYNNGNNNNNKNKNNNNKEKNKEILDNNQQSTIGLSFEEINPSIDNGFDYFPGDFSVNRQPQLPTTTTTINNPIQQQQIECGRVIMQPSPLISYGQNTTKGQFPWHAALYHSRGAELIYTCGGTLITDQFILTAAHCAVKPQSNIPINPSNLLVSLGKYVLKKFGPEVQDIEVSNIYVHPQYNYSNLFNDIAILKLARPIQITDYVRPCCLWDNQNNIELDNIVGQIGTVVGWGFNENRELSNDLMQTKMPIVSTVKCIYSNREFFSRFTFEKNFCAGYQNGTSVCNGDSGGGLLLPKYNNGNNGGTIWQIRGIVSVGVALQGYGVCDPSHYAVFTDVAKHLNWINDIIRKK